MDMQEIDSWVIQQSTDDRFRFIAMHDVGIDHHAIGIKSTYGQQTYGQLLGNSVVNWWTRGCPFPYEDGVGRPIGRIHRQMLIIDQ